MARDSFRFGSTEVNDGVTYAVSDFQIGRLTPTPGYRDWLAGGNPAFSYGFPMFEDTANGLSVLVSAATPAALSTAIAALRNIVAPGVVWAMTMVGRTVTTQTTVVASSSGEPYPVPPRSEGRVEAVVNMTVVTTPGWKEATATTTTGTITDGWGTFTVTAGGDMPSDGTLKVTNPVAATMYALGLMPAPLAAFDPFDDYSGTVDAKAIGGARSADSAALPTNGTYADVASAPTFDVNANRGIAEAFARTRTPAGAGRMTYRTAAAVTGSGVATTTTEFGDPVANVVAGNALEVLVLGKVRTPAGAVPGMETGSGYAASSELVSHKSGATGVTLASTLVQTVTLTAGQRVTGILLKGNTTGNDGVYVAIGGSPGPGDPVTLLPTGAAAEFTASLRTPYVVPSTGLYTFYIDVFYYGGGDTNALLKSTDSSYADGKLDGSNTDDLYFAVIGQSPLGFNASTTVRATTADAAQVASVDALMRVPCDHGYLHTWHTFAADRGILVDLGAEEDVYECAVGAGTAGPSVLGESDMRGNLRPRPGANTYALVCGLGDVNAGDAAWEATIHNVWSDPTFA